VTILQIPPTVVEQKIVPSEFKSASSFAARLSHRAQQPAYRTAATQPVALIMFIAVIPCPLTYQVVVLR
jgi:hypothetical protein